MPDINVAMALIWIKTNAELFDDASLRYSFVRRMITW